MRHAGMSEQHCLLDNRKPCRLNKQELTFAQRNTSIKTGNKGLREDDDGFEAGVLPVKRGRRVLL